MNTGADYIQAAAPDKKRLAELLIRAKGPGRTMAQFSEVTGINTSTLSRIANGKIAKPIPAELIQIIFDCRDESADFSFGMLLTANGMLEQSAIDRGKAFTEEFFSGRDRGAEIERHAKNAIMSALLARGIVVQSIPTDFNRFRVESPFGITPVYDFNFYVEDAPEKKWYFEVVAGSNRLPAGMGNTFSKASRFFLLDAWAPEFLADTKMTFVFTERAMLEQFILRFKGAPIKAALSALLIDPESETILDEVWMSASPETESALKRPLAKQGGFVSVWQDEDEDYDDE